MQGFSDNWGYGCFSLKDGFKFILSRRNTSTVTITNACPLLFIIFILSFLSSGEMRCAPVENVFWLSPSPSAYFTDMVVKDSREDREK